MVSSNVKKILEEIKTSNFILDCRMPLGYFQGIPILQILNERLCLTVPYLKYKMTGVVDKTLVFPIRYTVTVSLPDKKIISYKDLSFDPDPLFKNINYSKAIGFFRHENVKHLSKEAYRLKKTELFAEYNKVIDTLLYGKGYSDEDESKMRELLQMFVEPSQLPIYKALDYDFYNKYLV